MPAWISENVRNALMLMLTGMVGIFIVMIVLLAAIAILNRVTRTRSAGKEDDTTRP